jgi:response regulator RpfG family c-di-GMP phosphodiesterase
VIERFTSGSISAKDLERFTTSFEMLLTAGKNSTKKGGRMSSLVSEVMDRLGAESHERELALFASLVYDLGLSALGGHITKNRPLQPREQRAVRTHPAMAVTLLDEVEPSEAVKQAILHHHENFDGSGYPDHLKGEEIPLIARVLAVIDSFCAMTSPRPFRDSMTEEQALQELREGVGSRYDPNVVVALEKAVIAAKAL